LNRIPGKRGENRFDKGDAPGRRRLNHSVIAALLLFEGA
jgi:hypothetical protein